MFFQKVQAVVENEFRLTPAMTSRKLQVVSFAKQYLERWGRSPSYGEIAAAIGISPSRARAVVRSAVKDGLMYRQRGARRGISFPRPPLTSAEAEELLARLREAGFAGAERTPCTITTLPMIAAPEQEETGRAAE